MKLVAPAEPSIPETPAEASARRLLSRKEAAKEQRHAMYQRAKERRASDPRYLAMKEAVKEQRRATYQKVKEQRRATALVQKSQLKANHAAEGALRRAEADQALMSFVTGTSKAANE